MRKSIFLAILTCLLSTTALAQHEVPRHRATDWCHLALEDYTGNMRIPVIFINFENANGTDSKTITTTNFWMERLNDKCTTNHMRENGSVNDYFLAQSYGNLNVTFDNIGTYTAAGSGANYTEYYADGILATKALAAFPDVDWSLYDCNGDKEVDCVLFIYAGHADGDYNARKIMVSSIYPHRSWLTQRNLKYSQGEYKFDGYVFTSELRDGASSTSPISTVCHELSHGIFDFTDYYKSLYSYMGQYDAMCYGYRQREYSASDNHCCDFTSFNRMYMGWLTPRELSQSCHVTLQPLSRQADACIIYDPADENHFFLLENRAKLDDSWDKNLPAGGLVLVEVNWNRDKFEFHNVNAETRKNINVINAATSKGLAISNSVYNSYNQTGVPYGINGHNSIPATVSKVFAQQKVTNITINNDHSIEFDYENLTDGINNDLTTQDLTPASPKGRSSLTGVYDLTGRSIDAHAVRHGIIIQGGRKIVK